MFRLLAPIITLQRLYECIYNDFARINIAKIYTFLLKEVAFFKSCKYQNVFCGYYTCISLYIANTTCIKKKIYTSLLWSLPFRSTYLKKCVDILKQYWSTKNEILPCIGLYMYVCINIKWSNLPCFRRFQSIHQTEHK